MAAKGSKTDNESTFSRRPIISHDMPDEKGVSAEVLVCRGVGVPIEITGLNKLAKVEIAIATSQYIQSGYILKTSDAFKLCQKAMENKEPISYRIEISRKLDIDRTIPIEDLRQGNDSKNTIRRRLVAVKDSIDDQDDGKWLIDDSAIQTVIEDDFADLANPQNPYEDLDKYYQKKDAGSSVPEPEVSFGRKWTEAQPWLAYNNDGSLNLGSYLVQGIISLQSAVWELVKEHEYDVDEKQINGVIISLVSLVNKIQQDIYKEFLEMSEPVSELANSNTRVRAVVFDVLRAKTPTIEVFTDKKVRGEFMDELYKMAMSRWQVVIAAAKQILK